MPTTSRIDFGFASNTNALGETHTSPLFHAYGKGQIAQAEDLNRSDEAVASEAFRRLGIAPCACRIDYYGEQLGPDSIARVNINGRVVVIPIRNGQPRSQP